MAVIYPLFAGLIAALIHVISGPDHLAAVTPFAIETKKKAWRVGLLWGIGHILGMLSIGLLFMLFKSIIPIDLISEKSEFLVGIVLIGLGLWVFYKLFKDETKHRHIHVHSEEYPVIHEHEHKHDHTHALTNDHNHKHPKLKQSLIASLSVGFIHGLAGVAHFVLLLPVLGFTSQSESAFYIIGFGLGTVIAMVSFALVIGGIANYSHKEHHKTFFKGIQLTGGLFAVIIGIYWVLSKG